MVVKDLFSLCSTDEVLKELRDYESINQNDELEKFMKKNNHYVYHDYYRIPSEFYNDSGITKKIIPLRFNRNEYKEAKKVASYNRNYRKFINYIKSIFATSPDTDSILLGTYIYGNSIDGILQPKLEVSLYKASELTKCFKVNSDIENIKNVNDPGSTQLKEYLDILYGTEYDEEHKATNSILPSSYAYEFEDWENILRYKVYEDNVKQVGVAKFLSIILSEMSFFGFDEHYKRNQRDELSEMVDRVKEYQSLSDEEKEKSEEFKPCDLSKWREDLGIRENTKEEDLYESGVHSRENLYNAIQQYKTIRDNWYAEYMLNLGNEE